MGAMVNAFLLGVLSAASLGLGALTARVWRPRNFVLGLLTAFGAGALLSAVTIDIVAPAVEEGEFPWLAIGAVAGGLSFEGLNRVINARGGFLRKASTSLTFLRDREHRRRRDILGRLERIDIFDGVPERELDAIAKAFRTSRLDAGDILYRYGDPCEHLNVLADGTIQLTTPAGTLSLHPHQAFGHLAFVSGTQHRSTAVATTSSEVLRLSRERLRSVLGSCPIFAERLRDRIHSEGLSEYLRSYHREIGEERIANWLQKVDGEGVGALPSLVEFAVETPTERIVDHLEEVGPFRGSPPDLLDQIAGLMFREEHDAGYVFFRPGDAAERMYIIADGDVAIVQAALDADDSVLLQAGEEFGSLSFLTGLRHSATAIAQSPCEVWVLRRATLARMLGTDPRLSATIGSFLESERVATYLATDHRLTRDNVTGFVRKATSSLRRGTLPHAVSARVVHGAPLAIWLGLLLDAIPESLVIGATAGVVRVSFIVGIFLSNYPEALASSVGMREQQYTWRNILLLWGTVILVTGLGAGAGSVVFQSAPEHTFAIVEGLAAGAMITVITQTMMPEALHRSGGFVGLAALAGFLFTTLVGA